MRPIAGELVMNHKRKKPRTKSRSKGAFLKEAPAHWNIVYHSRPRRRRDRVRLVYVLHGSDPDLMLWELGNSRPHRYFW